MDFSPIITPLWTTVSWLIPLMLVIDLLQTPWAKGYIGELVVQLAAHVKLDQRTYRRLHNVTLNTPDGRPCLTPPSVYTFGKSFA